jgi:L-amino acid N-acyltransferase YncA
MSGLNTILVRPALRSDAPAIASIYNEAIRNRKATFETRERTAENILT